MFTIKTILEKDLGKKYKTKTRRARVNILARAFINIKKSKTF